MLTITVTGTGSDTFGLKVVNGYDRSGTTNLTLGDDGSLADEKTFTINVKSAVETPALAEDASFVYNGTAQTAFEVPENAEYTVSGDSLTQTNAGTYTATFTLTEEALKAGKVWDEDGSTGPKTLTWTIEKATLTATAQAQRIVFGAAVDTSVSVEGFLGDDTAENLEGFVAPTAVIYPYPYVEGESSPVEEADIVDGMFYTLVPEGGDATNNYQFSMVSAVLEIGTAIAVDRPTFDTASVVYDGAVHDGLSAEADIPEEGYTLSWAKVADDGTVTALDEAPKNAGTYTVTATLAAGYKWGDGDDVSSPSSSTYTIEKALLTVNARDALTQTIEWYETPNLVVDSSYYSGFVNGETYEGLVESGDLVAPTFYVNGTITASAERQSYLIQQDGSGSATNYSLSITVLNTTRVATLTVNAKPTVALTAGDGAEDTLASLVAGAGAVEVSLAYEGNPDVAQSDVTCSSSKEAVATASYDVASGTLTVTPVGKGSCVVTVGVAGDDTGMYEAASYSVAVVVADASVAGDDSAVSLEVGGTATVAGTYDGGGELSAASSDESVAQASLTQADDGSWTLTVTAVAAGTATITVSDGEGAEFQITVSVASASESSGKDTFGLGSVSVAAGRSVQNTLTLTDADGNEVDLSGLTVTVSSSAEGIATATCADGVLTVTGVAAGNATLTLSSDDLDADYTVAVVVVAQPTSITYSDNDTGVAVDYSGLALSLGVYEDSDADVRIEVNEISSGDAYDVLSAAAEGTVLGVYEVSLYVTPPEGEEVEVYSDFGTIEISFPVDSAYEGQQVTVRHRHHDGTITTETATVTDGMVTITVSDLSEFSVEAAADDGTSTDDDATSDDDETSSDDSTTTATGLSKTGDWFFGVIAGAAGILAAAAAACVCLWSRGRRASNKAGDDPLR